MDPLLVALERWKPFTALVVGDFMLDQLVFGDAERLAADAPVPILHVRKTEDRPGGAANVCLDLAALRGCVGAIGVIGQDAAGKALRRELVARGVGADGLVEDASRPTTVKQNLIGLAQTRHPQKMFRVDFESRAPIASERELLLAFERSLDGVDMICIEDYDKGVCTPTICRAVIEASRAKGKPVLVDPARGVDFSKYRGATAITPNRTEAELATRMTTDAHAGLEPNAAVARRLMELCELEAVVLTLDRHGALLLERGGEGVAVPTLARQVYDVTGAGDMFLAGLAAARANALGWVDAVRFANAAAGLEVEVFGVEPIPLDRIHHALLEQAGQAQGKVLSRDQVAARVRALRSMGRRVVFTNGCFDVLHTGHVTLLEKAAKMGDVLVVAINDDASVRRLKGNSRPVNSQDDRARVLAALNAVGMVVLFSEDTPAELLSELRPDVLVKGADYSKDRVVGADLVESWGGRVELVDLVEGRSTTGTIDKMRSTS